MNTKNKNLKIAADARAAAQTRIARAFRAHLARRPTDVTTLNAIPGRRRVQIGAQAHNASSIAELMHRGNWRDPLTRAHLTDAQAGNAWRLHTRNQAAEARRAGRSYAAPPMPQRPSANTGISNRRTREIEGWVFGGPQAAPRNPSPPRNRTPVRNPRGNRRNAAGFQPSQALRNPRARTPSQNRAGPPGPGYAGFLARVRQARRAGHSPANIMEALNGRRSPSPTDVNRVHNGAWGARRSPSPTTDVNRLRAHLAQLAIQRGNVPRGRSPSGSPVRVLSPARRSPSPNRPRRTVEDVRRAVEENRAQHRLRLARLADIARERSPGTRNLRARLARLDNAPRGRSPPVSARLGLMITRNAYGRPTITNAEGRRVQSDAVRRASERRANRNRGPL